MKYLHVPVFAPCILAILVCYAVFIGCSAGKGGGNAPEMDVTWDGTAVPDGAINEDLGTIQVDQSKDYTFTITNSGDLDLNLTGNPDKIVLSGAGFSKDESSTAASLAPGAFTTFTVTLDAAGAAVNDVFTADISVANDDGDKNPYNFSVQVTVAAQGPEINVKQDADNVIAGSNRDFGDVQVGGSATITFTIENMGMAALNLTAGPPRVSISGDPQFTLAGDAATPVPAQDSTTFELQYSPSAQEDNSATISIASDDPDNPTYEFTVSGTGIAPAPEINVQAGGADVPDGAVDYNVGTTGNDTPLNITFTIQNTGEGVLNLSGGPSRVTLTGDAAFGLDTDAAASVAAHGSTTFIIAFDPGGVDGTYHAAVSIANDDGDEDPYNFTIIAAAATPGIYVEESGAEVAQASTVDYGSTGAGTPVEKTYTITNDGNADLNISSVVLSGAGSAAYTLDTGGITSPVAPGAGTGFTLTFNTDTGGTYDGTITITTDDPVDGTYVFNTTALCEAPEINVTISGTDVPTGTDFYNLGNNYSIAGQPYSFTVTIHNLGNQTLHLSAVPTIRDNDDVLSIDSSFTSLTVDAGDTTTFDIVLSGLDAGDDMVFKYAWFDIVSDDCDEGTYSFRVRVRARFP